MPLTAKPLSTSPSLKSPSSPSKLKQSEAKPKPKPVSRRRCFTYSFFKSKLTQGYHRALSPHHLHHLDGQAGGTDRHITQPSWQRQRVCRVIHAAFSLSLSLSSVFVVFLADRLYTNYGKSRSDLVAWCRLSAHSQSSPASSQQHPAPAASSSIKMKFYALLLTVAVATVAIGQVSN